MSVGFKGSAGWRVIIFLSVNLNSLILMFRGKTLVIITFNNKIGGRTSGKTSNKTGSKTKESMFIVFELPAPPFSSKRIE